MINPGGSLFGQIVRYVTVDGREVPAIITRDYGDQSTVDCVVFDAMDASPGAMGGTFGERKVTYADMLEGQEPIRRSWHW